MNKYEIQFSVVKRSLGFSFASHVALPVGLVRSPYVVGAVKHMPACED